MKIAAPVATFVANPSLSIRGDAVRRPRPQSLVAAIEPNLERGQISCGFRKL